MFSLNTLILFRRIKSYITGFFDTFQELMNC